MNKTQLVEALSVRLGDRKSASAALAAFVTEIQNAVTKGEKVTITGFGVFEKRERAARTARNPRTGEPVKVKKTSVPAFRPGAGFRELVAAGKVPKASRQAASAKTVAPAPSRSVAAKKAESVRPASPAKKTGPARTSTTRAKSATTRAVASEAPRVTRTKATVAKATTTRTTAKTASATRKAR